MAPSPGSRNDIRGLKPEAVGGAFRLAIEGPGHGYRMVEATVALRCRLFALPLAVSRG